MQKQCTTSGIWQDHAQGQCCAGRQTSGLNNRHRTCQNNYNIFNKLIIFLLLTVILNPKLKNFPSEKL